MGSNEIKNSIEACAWISAGSAAGSEGNATVEADNFFFRSISGFIDRIDVLGADFGTDWVAVPNNLMTIGLYLDRNYSRNANTFLLQNIDSIRAAPDSPEESGDIVIASAPRVLPLTDEAYVALITNQTPPEPDDLDPFSRQLIYLDLSTQIEGHGCEFGIELLGMPQNEDNSTDVENFTPPPP